MNDFIFFYFFILGLHEDKKWYLALHSMYTSWKLTHFHATHLLAFLKKFHDLPKEDDMEELVSELKSHKRSIAFQTHDYGDAIKHSEMMLSNYAGSTSIDESLSNSVMIVYFNESVCATAIGSLISSPIMNYVKTNAQISVKSCDLVEQCLDIFSLLSFECQPGLPCQDMTDIIYETFERFKFKEILYVKEEMKSEHFHETKSRRLAHHIER